MNEEPRKIHATYFDGEVRIDFGTVLDYLDTDAKRDLIQRLACEGDVIVAVVDQLVTGWTENISHGRTGVLDAQRRRLIDTLGTDVLKRVVREALQEAASARASEKRADETKDALVRAVRDFTRDCREDLGCRAIASAVWKCRAEWKFTTVSDKDALAFIEKVAGEIEVVRQAKVAERAAANIDAFGEEPRP